MSAERDERELDECIEPVGTRCIRTRAGRGGAGALCAELGPYHLQVPLTPLNLAATTSRKLAH